MADLLPLTPHNPDAHIRMVILGDGYTASERAQFVAQAQAIFNGMFEAGSRLADPLPAYRDLFDVTAIFTPTGTSGIDAAPSPTSSSMFGTHRDGRLIGGNSAAVDSFLRDVYGKDLPDFVLVLANTAEYGGGAATPYPAAPDGSYPAFRGLAFTAGGSAERIETTLHETGHSYAHLDDEYPQGPPNFAFSGVNTSTYYDNVAWKDWLGFEDALGKIGKYQEDAGQSVWRATFDSKMKTLGVAFNAPEKEAWILRFYADQGHYLGVDQPIAGVAAARAPILDNLAFAWNADGQPVDNGGGRYLDTLALGDGAHRITVDSIDGTGMVRKDLDTTRDSASLALPAARVVASTRAQVDATLDHVAYRLGDGDDTLALSNPVSGVHVDGGAGNDRVTVHDTWAAYRLRDLGQEGIVAERGATPAFALRHVEALEFDDRAVLFAGAGDQDIAGGPGADMLYRSGKAADYTIAYDAATGRYAIADTVAGRDGLDTVTDVESVRFADGIRTLRAADPAPAPTYTVTALQDGVHEGGSAWWMIQAQDAAPGSSLTLDLGGAVTAADLLAGRTTASARLGLGGSALFRVDVSPDGAAEGGELLKVAVAGSGANGTEAGAGAGATVLDGPAPASAPAAPAYYAAHRADYTIDQHDGVVDVRSAAGTDTLTGFDRLLFGDGAVALDTDGAVAQVARLYQVALGRAADPAGMGFYIDVLDRGVGVAQIAHDFAASNEFAQLYGAAPSHRALVDGFYDHVLHRAGDAGGVAYWVGLLDQGKTDVAGVLLGFVDSAESRASLVGSMAHGIDFMPYAA